MSEPKDYTTDVAKYTQPVNEAAVKGIVRHCGIALHKLDSSLVAATDPAELKTVRDSFLKKKLGLTMPDAELDTAIQGVMTKMHADHTKSRVTVYYLLAEQFGKLGDFVS
jgi:hypothetical protein